MSLDRMKSLLYVSPLLSQARNTFIKWRFIHRLSLVQGWHCWECPGQLSLGVLWSPRWLKYCRLSLWLLARGTSWLLDCQCHSLFPVMTRVWICAHVGTPQRPFQMGPNPSPSCPAQQQLIDNCEYELLAHSIQWIPILTLLRWPRTLD